MCYVLLGPVHTVDKDKFDFVDFRLCQLLTLSLVQANWRQSQIRQLVVVDIVSKLKMFKSVNFVESDGDFRQQNVKCPFDFVWAFWHSVIFVEFNKIDRFKEFNFVANVYRALSITFCCSAGI